MSVHTIAMIVNLFVVILSLVGTLILVRRLKFDDNNSRLIFLLYIVYWMAPLLCRDYTTSMHLHMNIDDGVKLMWIPVAVFGLVGIFWRPLNDILTYKFKSRKLIIYLSILVQLITILPFLIYPCFATNIIQSIGTGVGASGIGLFTLMFNENQKHHKKFLTISIFALPPIIAGILVSSIESFVASYVSEQHSLLEYRTAIWYIWLIALIFILTSFVIAFFVKENRATLYQDKQYKEPVIKKRGHWKLILICLCGACLAMIRWSTAGPYSGLQLTRIAIHANRDSSIWEGYLGLAYSIGCLIGSIISAVCIVKFESKKYQPIIIASAVLLWIIYLGINCSFVSVPVYFWTNIVNGIGFGLMWNIFILITLNKFYVNHDVITPIGVFNSSLSVGLTIGSVFIGLTKAKHYDFHGTLTSWNDFLRANQTTSVVLLIITVMLLLFFVGYYVLDTKYKLRRAKVEKSIKLIGETEL